MKIIVPVDDRLGMLFNKRRQSRDQNLCTYILGLTQNRKLWMMPYSAPLFDALLPNICVDEQALDKAEEEDFCFVETVDPSLYEDRISDIYLCRWNRSYPADLHFGISLSSWEMLSFEDIVGSSHEKITIEHYRRKD